MKLFTFTGETPAIALKKAQAKCGEDALVVSTKQLKKKSLTSDSLYEVVVALEEDIPEKESNKEQKKNDDILVNISEAAKQISQIAKVSNEPLYTKKSSLIKESSPTKENIDKNDEFYQIKKELTKLADKMKTVQHILWDERSSDRNNLNIPPEFAEIYNIAKKSGMSSEHLDSIMRLTLEHMPSRMRESTVTIKRYFQVLLKKMIPIRVEKDIPKGIKKVMMFVGPTGVGKTTTLAKLAARYSFLNYKYKVGLITLDTYRIGAVEQLFQYAKMMKLPIEDVVDIDDFNKALKSLNYCDLILVDTVGSSQYDKEKIKKIKEFIQKSDTQIDINLVLSASIKIEDLKEMYDNFSFLDIDTMIITKFDESKGFGNIFSLIYETQKPVSYFSFGQEVPDDIAVASSEYLIDCILDGKCTKKVTDGNSSK